MWETAKQPCEDHGFVRFDKSDIERSIPEIFERQVRADPGRTAVGREGQALSYDDLNRLSNRIAHAILRRRADKEEPVALLFRQGAMAVAATLGSLKSGKIYVPLDLTQPLPELQKIMAHCGPSLVVAERATEALAGSLMDEAKHCLNVDTMAGEEPESNPGLVLQPDRVCYVFYTSGTTGPPKGVFDNHRNVLHNVMRYTNNLGIGAKDRLSLIGSCINSGTVSDLFCGLLNGAAVCPFDLKAEGIARLARWVESQRITVFHYAPAVFERLMAAGGTFDSLRIIRLEGDRTEPRQIRLFHSRFGSDCVLVNGLGLTEAGIVRQYFVTPRSEMVGDVVPIGHAIEDMEINLVDHEGRKVEPGGVGEITIRSKYLACGYWQRPDLTEAAFASDPDDGEKRVYRTGDLGRMAADNCLEFLGRKDFQAKLRGQWVETSEVEAALCALDSISQVLVMVRDDGLGAQQLVAYLVAAGPQPSIDGLRRALEESLPTAMIPSRYVFLDSMPLDRNGKVNRRALPAPGRHRPDLEQSFVAPRNREEEIVAECFCRTLNIDQVGVYDEFLDLGGDSLLATELLMRLEERLEVDCPAALVSQTFSVASLLSRLGQDYPETALVLIQAGDDRPPLFCFHNYSGYVLDYYRLAACLDPDRTVYGLQSRAFTRAGCQDARIEDMAAAYLTEITALEIDGPYHLCGNCFGGTIAFEIAQQLRREGRDVATLALIDTAFPGSFFYDMATRIQNPHWWRQLSRLPAWRWPLHFAQRFQKFARWAAARRKKWLLAAMQGVPGTGHRPDSHDLGVLDRNKLAEVRYKPRRYDGEIHLICPGRPNDQRGWVGVAAAGCNVIEVPYDGQSEKSPHLTDEPYVGKLAEHMSAILQA